MEIRPVVRKFSLVGASFFVFVTITVQSTQTAYRTDMPEYITDGISFSILRCSDLFLSPWTIIGLGTTKKRRRYVSQSGAPITATQQFLRLPGCGGNKGANRKTTTNYLASRFGIFFSEFRSLRSIPTSIPRGPYHHVQWLYVAGKFLIYTTYWDTHLVLLASIP
jgi:hypothetical protein